MVHRNRKKKNWLQRLFRGVSRVVDDGGEQNIQSVKPPVNSHLQTPPSAKRHPVQKGVSGISQSAGKPRTEEPASGHAERPESRPAGEKPASQPAEQKRREHHASAQASPAGQPPVEQAKTPPAPERVKGDDVDFGVLELVGADAGRQTQTGHAPHETAETHVNDALHEVAGVWPQEPPKVRAPRKDAAGSVVQASRPLSGEQKVAKGALTPQQLAMQQQFGKPSRQARQVTPLFRLRGVYKIYGKGDNKIVALNNVNIDIPDHKMVAVVGDSGFGKTTLLNILGGIDKPDYGKVYYRSRLIDYDDEKFMQCYRLNDIGWVFQELNLINHLNVWKNVALPLVQRGYKWNGRTKETVLHLLESIELGNKSGKHPYQLSVGQRQRVAVARAFAANPNVILADEPTGSLDKKTGRIVMDLLRDFQKRRKTSVILITHNTDLANEYCSCIFEFIDTGIIERRE